MQNASSPNSLIGDLAAPTWNGKSGGGYDDFVRKFCASTYSLMPCITDGNIAKTSLKVDGRNMLEVKVREAAGNNHVGGFGGIVGFWEGEEGCDSDDEDVGFEADVKDI